MAYEATKHRVANRGIPPDRFLDELVAWGKIASNDIFAPNPNQDMYSSVFGVLGPYEGFDYRRDVFGYRRAVMLEVMRVLAGFESSWNWYQGSDAAADHRAASGGRALIWIRATEAGTCDDYFLQEGPMHLTIRDGWFSGDTAIHIGGGEDLLIFERCTFHGCEIKVEPEVNRPVFIRCLFQGTAFTVQRLNPRIAERCRWEPATTEAATNPLSPALSLRESCRREGYDNDGKRCPGCPLKELCESEERWLVRLTAGARLA